MRYLWLVCFVFLPLQFIVILWIIFVVFSKVGSPWIRPDTKALQILLSESSVPPSCHQNVLFTCDFNGTNQTQIVKEVVLLITQFGIMIFFSFFSCHFPSSAPLNICRMISHLKSKTIVYFEIIFAYCEISLSTLTENVGACENFQRWQWTVKNFQW